MRVEVGICTWNRAKLLDQTLMSMRALRIPSDVEWELVVVNNHSTDNTEEVIARHEEHLPIRRLWEPTLGKSTALNTAIDAMRGDLILWSDDDVIIDPDWLAEYASAAQRYPDAAFFGGTIEPWFEVDPPPWTTAAWNRISTVYAARDVGDEEFPVDATTLPFGANWAIRTEVQRRFRYDCRLGRVGPNDVRGEECAILRQMLADGIKGHWIPQAKLQHFIPKERLTLEYVRQFYYGIGQTAALLKRRKKISQTKLWLRKAYYRLRVAMYEMQYRLYRHIASPSRWIKKMSGASYSAGKLASLSAPGTFDISVSDKREESVKLRIAPITQDTASQPREELPQDTTHGKRAA